MVARRPSVVHCHVYKQRPPGYTAYATCVGVVPPYDITPVVSSAAICRTCLPEPPEEVI